jgi:hypothetical protein
MRCEEDTPLARRRQKKLISGKYNMVEKISVHAKGLTTRLLSVLIVFMFAVSLAACIAAVPLAVKYVKEKDMAKLTMEVDGKAEERGILLIRFQLIQIFTEINEEFSRYYYSDLHTFFNTV